jgi:hypothetical protein
MTFYIGIETLAQIENYSFPAELNLGTASLTTSFDEIFLLAVRHRDDPSAVEKSPSRRSIHPQRRVALTFVSPSETYQPISIFDPPSSQVELAVTTTII